MTGPGGPAGGRPAAEPVHAPPAAGRPVVVGLEPSWRSAVALEWALAEARSRGAPLLLAHAVGHVADAGRAADDLLAEATARVAAAAPGLPVRAVRRRADPAALLTAASRGAALVVVGAPEPAAGDAVTGSVGMRLAAASSAPVAVVRGDHAPGRPCDWPVVAALAAPFRGDDPVLACAFEVARRDRRPVVAVHAVAEGDPRRIRAALAEALAPWAAGSPRVRTRVDVALDGPDRALLDRSDHAALLVLGIRRLRHGTAWDRLPVLAPLLARVGPLLGLSPLEVVAAWRSRCPVVLVP